MNFLFVSVLVLLECSKESQVRFGEVYDKTDFPFYLELVVMVHY